MEEFFEKNAKQIVNLGVGNCFELDIIAIMCMKEYKTYFSLSVNYELLGFFGRENGDHSLSSCFSLGETSDHIDDNSSMCKK